MKTAIEILNEHLLKSNYQKPLLDYEKQFVVDAMEEYAKGKYDKGYMDGSNDAAEEAREEINEHYTPND